MAEIRVGTASWTDPTLIKGSDFYPRRTMTATERLQHYASIFPLVEVDATFYHPPSRDLAGLWVERTPDGFEMDVKAYGLFTGHGVNPKSVWEDVAADLPTEHREKRNVYLEHLPEKAAARAWDHFRDALMPLHSAGKLGAVFFQFPPWFRPRRDTRAYLRALPGRLPDYRIAVEFRHSSWLAENDDRRRTLEILEEAGLSYTCVDEPQGFDTSVPPIVTATTDLAVLRFHGHNKENWEKKGITAAERFRYLYSDEELAGWAPQVRDLAKRTRDVHVLFNNCYEDYGVRNAQQLARLLGAGLQHGQL